MGRPPQLAIPASTAANAAANAAALSPGSKGALVEVGEGWWKATPSDGGRPYYWHRKNGTKQFDPPVMRLAVLNKKLLAAADDRDVALVLELLSMGADIDAADPSGTTCVMKAVMNDDMKCLSALVGGADARPNLEARNALGRTALHIASFWGRIGQGSDSGILGALLRAGCSVDATVSGRNDEAGSTPLDMACVGIVGPANVAGSSSPFTPRTPPVTPRTPGTPRALPGKADVELLLRVGPDAFEAQKRAELDAAQAKRDQAKQRAMLAALSKARRKIANRVLPPPPLESETAEDRTSFSEADRLAQEERLREKIRQQEELRILLEAAAAQKEAAAEEKRRERAEQEAAATRIQAALRGKNTRLAQRAARLASLVDDLRSIADAWMQDVDEFSAGDLEHVIGLLSTALRLIQSEVAAGETIAQEGGYEVLTQLRSLGQQLSAMVAQHLGGDSGQAPDEIERSLSKQQCHTDTESQQRRRLELAIVEVNMSTSVMTNLDPVSTAALLRAEAFTAGAARRIQAHFRGKRGRTELKQRRIARDAHNRALLARATLFVQSCFRVRAQRRKKRLEKERARRRRALREQLLQRLVQKSRMIQKNLLRWPAAAITIQAFIRGRAVRRAIAEAVRVGGAAGLWAMNGHVRAAREWFLRFDCDRDQVLNRTELRNLVVELRDQHGLPVADRMVARETAELLDGSWLNGQATWRQRTGLRWIDWLQIVTAAERGSETVASLKGNGWSARDPQLPPLDNKWYPVTCPSISACAAPCVARKPLEEALWIWCGLSRDFL